MLPLMRGARPSSTIVIVAFVAIHFAGCIDDGTTSEPDEKLVPPPPDSGGPSTTAPPPASPPQNEDPLLPGLVQTLQLTGCDQWDTGIYIRKELHPARVPPEWEINNTFGLADIVYWIWDCHRISAGVMERPVKLVLELHGHGKPPASCENPDDEYWWIIHRTWTDDSEFAQMLEERMHLRSEVVPISVSSDGTGATFDVVRWGEPTTESSLTWEYVADSEPPVPTMWGFYWFTDTGVAYAQLDGFEQGPGPHTLTVYGDIAAGLLYHEAIGKTFIGTGDIVEAEYEGRITYYEDLLCEWPAR